MQMAQLPLIMVGRAKIFKQNPGLGNVRYLALVCELRLCPFAALLLDRAAEWIPVTGCWVSRLLCSLPKLTDT